MSTSNENQDSKPVDDSDVQEVSSPRLEPDFNLESHVLTAREQLMINWPGQNWERR